MHDCTALFYMTLIKVFLYSYMVCNHIVDSYTLRELLVTGLYLLKPEQKNKSIHLLVPHNNNELLPC